MENSVQIPIDERMIPGVNFKIIRMILMSAITLAIFICATYYSIKMDLHDLKSENDYKELRMKSIELNMSVLRADVENLRNQINATTVKLDAIEKGK